MKVTIETTETDLPMQPKESLMPVAQPPLGLLRTLIIEDEETDRFQLMTMCRRAGLKLEVH